MLLRISRTLVTLSLLGSLALVGCGGSVDGSGGGSPQTDAIQRGIAKAVLGAAPHIYDAGDSGAEVTAVQLASREQEGGTGGMPNFLETTWTAKMRLKEPLALVLRQEDGKRVVRVVAQAGQELDFQGFVTAAEAKPEWQVQANARFDSEYGPWKPIWDPVAAIKPSQPGIDQEQLITGGGLGAPLQPLSRLKPYVIDSGR